MLDADGYDDYVDAYDGTEGWLSVRSFAAARTLIERCKARLTPLDFDDLETQAQQRMDDHAGIFLDNPYRLRLALGASYVLLVLRYGDLMQDPS